MCSITASPSSTLAVRNPPELTNLLTYCSSKRGNGCGECLSLFISSLSHTHTHKTNMQADPSHKGWEQKQRAERISSRVPTHPAAHRASLFLSTAPVKAKLWKRSEKVLTDSVINGSGTFYITISFWFCLTSLYVNNSMLSNLQNVWGLSGLQVLLL